MALAYEHPHKPTVCPYNSECRCKVQMCGNCGWNPLVANDRIKKLFGKVT